MSSGVILLQRPYFSFSSPLLLILSWEITTVAVALFNGKFKPQIVHPYINPYTPAFGNIIPGFYLKTLCLRLILTLWGKYKLKFANLISKLNFLKRVNTLSNGQLLYRSTQPVLPNTRKMTSCIYYQQDQSRSVHSLGGALYFLPV